MNKTFEGENSHYNACVGNNGHIDYITYSDGYDEMVKIGLAKLEDPTILNDVLVYPLIYSARHRIELLLKHQLMKINYIKYKLLSNENRDQIFGTHKISKLWEMLKNETSFETRFAEPINSMDGYIKDFAEIDDTGEVFRYPVTLGGDKHLADIQIVNLLSFKTRYLELSQKLEDFDHYSSHIVTEYEQGTFAGNLSRKKIKNLAQDLPKFTTWSDRDEFQKVKKEIKEKYDISSNTLSTAIDLIKNNFEFSEIIGKEILITAVSKDELKSFIQMYDQFLTARHEGDYNSTIEEYTEKIKSDISEDAIIALAQLYDIAYFRLYPEEFSRGLEGKKAIGIETLIRFYLLGNGIVKEKIMQGLDICCQRTLLESIEA